MTAVGVPKARWSWSLFALGISFGLLLVPLVRGNADARIGAAAGLVAIVGALALGVRRRRIVEYGDDPSPPSTIALVIEVAARSGRIAPFWGAYLALLFVATVGDGSGPAADSTWAGPLIAVTATLALAAALLYALRYALRSEGVERELFLRATCVAFFVSMIFAAAHALFEVLADVSPIDTWVVWLVGMGAWLGAHVGLDRKAR